MSDLIPNISWTEFKKLNIEQLVRLKCCEITYNGGYKWTFVNGALEPSGYLRTQTEYRCLDANAVGGETLEEILEKDLAVV